MSNQFYFFRIQTIHSYQGCERISAVLAKIDENFGIFSLNFLKISGKQIVLYLEALIFLRLSKARLVKIPSLIILIHSLNEHVVLIKDNLETTKQFYDFCSGFTEENPDLKQIKMMLWCYIPTYIYFL